MRAISNPEYRQTCLTFGDMMHYGHANGCYLAFKQLKENNFGDWQLTGREVSLMFLSNTISHKYKKTWGPYLILDYGHVKGCYLAFMQLKVKNSGDCQLRGWEVSVRFLSNTIYHKYKKTWGLFLMLEFGHANGCYLAFMQLKVKQPWGLTAERVGGQS